MKTKFLFFTLGLFIFTSCFDTEDTPTPDTSSSCKMNSFAYGDEYFLLTYDDDGQISSYTEYEKEDDDFDGTYTIQRDDSGRVISMTQVREENENDEVYSFDYNDSNSIITLSESDSEYKTKLKFEGPIENMKLIEMIEAVGHEYEYRHKYTWSNGNIVKEEYGSSQNMNTIFYEYYDSPNLLKEATGGAFFLFPDIALYSDHNIKEMKTESGSYIVTYTYTYHEDGRVNTQTVEEKRTDTEPTYSGTYTYTYAGCE